MKPSPLLLIRRYLPGLRYGGPLRSIVNIVDALGGDLDIRVCCLDRDLGDMAPYPGLDYDHWMPVAGARVHYLRPRWRLVLDVLKVLNEQPRETIYLSGTFDPIFSILPLFARRLGLLGRRPMVIAARGELAPAALALKALKKRVFLGVASLIGLHKGVIWHATKPAEADEIHAVIGAPRQTIRIVGNLPTLLRADESSFSRGASRPLRIAFLSLIGRMKNLSFALNMLRRVQSPVVFTIYGTIVEHEYWAECQALRGTLPPHIQTVYGGEVRYENVAKELATQDVFLLPSLGENFGHVIFEALEMGLPVVISDRTPWRNLQAAGVGYDLSLDDENGFAKAIDALAAMPADEFAQMRRRAYAHAQDWLHSQNLMAAIKDLLTNPEKRD
jgi:glycosyltransferase involved in cell wall biosynthesis